MNLQNIFPCEILSFIQSLALVSFLLLLLNHLLWNYRNAFLFQTSTQIDQQLLCYFYSPCISIYYAIQCVKQRKMCAVDIINPLSDRSTGAHLADVGSFVLQLLTSSIGLITGAIIYLMDKLVAYWSQCFHIWKLNVVDFFSISVEQ